MTSIYSAQKFTPSNGGRTINKFENPSISNMQRHMWRNSHSSLNPRGHAYLLSEFDSGSRGSILSIENQQRLAILRSGAKVVSRTIWLWL